MATAIDVAKKILQLAAAEDEPEPMTHLRLQKLLYYVQGWCLGIGGTPMFPDRIEAWAHGPVVRDLFSVFKDYGAAPILPLPDSPKLAPEEEYFVAKVWEAYKGYSAIALRDMTHREQPWIDARGSCAPADKCTNEITHASLRAFFSKAVA